jgi:hypothetical protein
MRVTPITELALAANVLIPHVHATGKADRAIHHKDLSVIAQVEYPAAAQRVDWKKWGDADASLAHRGEEPMTEPE